MTDCSYLKDANEVLELAHELWPLKNKSISHSLILEDGGRLALQVLLEDHKFAHIMVFHEGHTWGSMYADLLALKQETDKVVENHFDTELQPVT